MRFSAYIILILMLSMSLYFVGFQSPFLKMQSNSPINGTLTNESGISTMNPSKPFTITQILEDMAKFVMSDAGIGLIVGIAGVASIVSLLSGQGINFIIPIVFMLLLANYFVFPVGDILIFLPFPFNVMLIVVFNAMLVISVMTFIRGDA